MATGTLVDVVMPQMGVSVSEGTITKWSKGEGEAIEADETLLEISTDKVDTEVPSPATGVVQQILVQEGETVPVGTKLAVIAPEGAEGAAAEEPSAAEAQEAEAPAEEAPPEPATQEAAAESAAASGAEGETPSAEQVAAESEPPAPQPTPSPAPLPVEPEDGQADGARFVSPVVARIASEHNVDVSQVSGTGRGGRVTKKDILGFVESGGAAAAPAEAPEAPAAPAVPARRPRHAARGGGSARSASAGTRRRAAGGRELEAMSPMRRGIAEHMRRSLDTAAHVTSSIEVDMSKVVSIRVKLKKEYQAAYGVNPTYLAFVARAAVRRSRTTRG